MATTNPTNPTNPTANTSTPTNPTNPVAAEPGHSSAYATLENLNGRNGCIYIVCPLVRPGALMFATKLEHEHYPVGSVLNDAYHIFHINYCDTPYYIIEIPGSDLGTASRLAQECNLKPLNGKPFSPGHNFNLLCDAMSCFTLESYNASAGPEPVYNRAKEIASVEEYLASKGDAAYVNM